MKFVRIFLWGLVATMTLQGYLKADEYGSEAGLIGGMSITMSIWGERARSLFGSGPKYVPLPRAAVTAALQETSRHPGSFGERIPQLRRALTAHQQAWSLFHERQIAWMLRHSDFVGGLLIDSGARAEWNTVGALLQKAVEKLRAAEELLCTSLGRTARWSWCNHVDEWIMGNKSEVDTYKKAHTAWSQLLTVRPISALDWWHATQAPNPIVVHITAIHAQLETLYNVTHPSDARIRDILVKLHHIGNGGWVSLVVRSLLEGELWSACLDHIRQRESRVRNIMVSTGIQELIDAHERSLNASLRIVGVDTPAARLVGEWFMEMMGYAWWIGEDMPSIVRRCVAQETGDCVRIGPTEIAALTAQMDRATAIVADSVRRIFIGMWNALPALTVLFIVELIMLICGVRVTPHPAPLMLPPVPQPQQPPTPGPIMFQLENRRKKRLFLTQD